MKPRLDVAPYTQEDKAIQVDVVRRLGRIIDGSMLGFWVMEHSTRSDRGDADLMFFMTRFGVRHWSTWTPRPRPPFWMATAHTFLRIDPEWPAGHHIIDLT